MNDPKNAQAVKDAKVQTTICTVCFCALVDSPDQVDNHLRWHEARDAAAHIKEVAQ